MSQKVLFLLGIILHIYGGENNFEIKVLNPEIGLPGIINNNNQTIMFEPSKVL